MVRLLNPLSPVASMVEGAKVPLITMVLLASVKLSTALERLMLPFTVMVSPAAVACSTPVPVPTRLPWWVAVPTFRSSPARFSVPEVKITS